MFKMNLDILDDGTLKATFLDLTHNLDVKQNDEKPCKEKTTVRDTITASLLKHLTSVIDKNDVTEVDLSCFNDTKFVNWDKLTSHLVKLLLKKNIRVVYLSHFVFIVVKGKCHGWFLKELKQKLGDDVSIGEHTLKLRDIIKSNVITDKLQILNQMSKTDIQVTIATLNNLHTRIDEVTPALALSVTKAYKTLRKHHRILHDEKKHANIKTMKSAKTNLDTSKIKANKRKAPMINNNAWPDAGKISCSLQRKKICHVCKEKFQLPLRNDNAATKRYTTMCVACAEFNLENRLLRTDLHGRIAVVTGGRIKIGYETVLKLLRDGCQVIVTTRFPHDAAARYANEEDCDDWKDKLSIYPLDMKDIRGELSMRSYNCVTFIFYY